VESADEVRLQEISGERVEVNTDSSSYDTDNGNGDEGRSVEHGDLDSQLLEVEGGLVADQVLEEMPQSVPVSVGMKQGPDSLAKKGNYNGLKAPWVSLFRDNRNLGKGIKLDVVESEEDLLQIEEEDVDDVEEAWGFCLVGQFAGKLPGMGAVRSIREG